METIDISFDALYERCVYSSLAHAVYTFRDPFFAYEQSWDNLNYSFCFGSTRGTISFDIAHCVAAGAVREDISIRRQLYPGKQAYELFALAPQDVFQLAKKETLEYLYDTIDNISYPVVTAVMWHDGTQVFLPDEKQVFAQHGGDFILLLSNPMFDLNQFWKNQYNLTQEELTLLEEISKYIKKDNQLFTLPSKYKSMLKESNGFNEGIELLMELGIEIRF